MPQYRKKDYIPNTQKIFVLFSALFVIAVAVILAVNSRFEDNAPPVSSASDIPSYTSVPSVDTSRAADESTSSEENGSSDAASGSGVSGIPDVSDDEPVSEEISDAPVVTDLPYDPAKLLDLRKEDILTTELDSYFENSVFIGNSLTVHFYNYVCARRLKNPGFLGSAKFFCTYGYSAYNDLNGGDDKLPKYKGEALHTWQAVRAMKAKTVYIDLMGLTEIWKYSYSKSPEKTFESHAAMIERIRSENPGVRIVLLSSSYMVKSFNSKARALNNYLLSRFNAIALDWCNKNGCDFIDVSTPFLDGNAIRDEYCRDPDEKGQGCHIKNEYYSAWIGVLRNYAYQKRNSTWRNPTEMRIIPA